MSNGNHADVLNIGVKLRIARQQKQLSLRELAARAEVSPSLLSQIENGKANPSVMTLHNVATALEVPITFFFPDPAKNGKKPAQVVVNKRDKTPSEMQTDDKSKFDLPAQQSPEPVLHPQIRLAIELMGGVRWERLTPIEEDNIQFLEVQYQPGATSGSAMSHHCGREFGLVLAGELKLELGFEVFRLAAGDSIIFDSATPHRLHNEGNETLRAIWVTMK
jgi:transcriptional regulator with XRE-family HTH domain